MRAGRRARCRCFETARTFGTGLARARNSNRRRTFSWSPAAAAGSLTAALAAAHSEAAGATGSCYESAQNNRERGTGNGQGAGRGARTAGMVGHSAVDRTAVGRTSPPERRPSDVTSSTGSASQRPRLNSTVPCA